MRSLHIIMPMAGEGSRFFKEGYTIPKPLIRHKNIPLFQRAISSVKDIVGPRKYSFIVRREHIDNYNIDSQIKNILPTARIFSISETTRGAVETCMVAQSAIDKEDAILVMDCDLEFSSQSYNSILTNLLSKKTNEVNGGALVSFHSDSNRYSYAKTDQNGLVLRTAEKEVISNHALIGAYFFSKAKSFTDAADNLLNRKDFNKPEYYVSLLYNYLLERGETVQLAEADTYYSYGTPEELNRYL